MPIEVILPKVDMDMSTGTIAGWHKSEGEFVQKGESLFDIETDKAVMEVESPGTGTLSFVSAQKGDEVSVGHVVALLFEEGEEVTAPAQFSGASETPVTDETGGPQPRTRTPGTTEQTLPKETSTRATPLARRVAGMLEIELRSVRGSGPRGRISVSDVAASVKQDLKPPPIPAGAGPGASRARRTADSLGLAYSSEPVSKMRSAIASRLTASKSTVPHFCLHADVELDALLAFRSQINAAMQSASARRVSINGLLVKSCATALHMVPEANVSWDGDQVIRYEDAHISVAVAVDGGIVTPVLRYAQTKNMQTITVELGELVSRARAGRLPDSDCQGGSFSISNLGMYGVKSFDAIINAPESMILAVGQGSRQFIPDDEDQPRAATIMNVSLSCDHRVVDGVLGARWLRSFKMIVESPTAMIQA